MEHSLSMSWMNFHTDWREIGKKPTYLVQGTLHPDVIESRSPHESGDSHSHTIKTHHNVGGLSEDMKLKLVEPFKWLFQDEVREMGALLDIPDSFLKQHTFPGHVLAVRIIGDVTQENALDTLRLVRLGAFYKIPPFWILLSC